MHTIYNHVRVSCAADRADIVLEAFVRMCVRVCCVCLSVCLSAHKLKNYNDQNSYM